MTISDTHLADYRQRIRLALATNGKLTTAQLAVHLGITVKRDQRLAAALTVLRRDGEIVVAGVEPGRTGFACNVWALPSHANGASGL